MHPPVPPSRPLLARLVGWTVTLATVGLAAVTLLPTLLGYGRYTIVSGSMTGTYDTGAMIYTKEIPTTQLRVGDVITYAPPAGTSPQPIVTHRIFSRTVDAQGEVVFRTKGDANQSADDWTFALDAPTQATVRFGVPYLGYGVSALARPEVRRIVVGVPAVLIALFVVGGLLRDARREALEAARAQDDATAPAGDAPPESGPEPVEPYTVFPAEHRRQLTATR
jgi:signal peptidase I